MKELSKQFWKETSKLIDAHRKNDDERAAQGVVDSRIVFNRLVKKLTLTDVVKSLPNKEKLNFEDWLEFKKIDKLSDGAYRREGSLYTEYYVKSSYETYLK